MPGILIQVLMHSSTELSLHSLVKLHTIIPPKWCQPQICSKLPSGHPTHVQQTHTPSRMPVHLLALPGSTKSRVGGAIDMWRRPQTPQWHEAATSAWPSISPSEDPRQQPEQPVRYKVYSLDSLSLFCGCPSPAKPGFAVSTQPEIHLSRVQSSFSSLDTRAFASSWLRQCSPAGTYSDGQAWHAGE